MTWEQGASLRLTLEETWKDGTPVDFTGAVAKMQLRGAVSDSSAILELNSNSNGYLSFGTDPTEGLLHIHVPDEVTAGLSFDRAKYDLRVSWPDGDKTFEVRGDITLLKAVTR